MTNTDYLNLNIRFVTAFLASKVASNSLKFNNNTDFNKPNQFTLKIAD